VHPITDNRSPGLVVVAAFCWENGCTPAGITSATVAVVCCDGQLTL
jgi:hypothetical protein